MILAAVFASLGVAMEVVFTAATDYPKKRSVRLMGYSYVWMLPIYAMVPFFLDVLHPRFGGWWVGARLALYTSILMIMEYVTGWALMKTTGSCPWEPEYRGRRWAVHGLVRLDFFPTWALACFVFERFYLELR